MCLLVFSCFCVCVCVYILYRSSIFDVCIYCDNIGVGNLTLHKTSLLARNSVCGRKSRD